MTDIILKLKQDEVHVIGEALLELPAKKSLHVINNINVQISEQLQPKAKAKAQPKTK